MTKILSPPETSRSDTSKSSFPGHRRWLFALLAIVMVIGVGCFAVLLQTNSQPVKVHASNGGEGGGSPNDIAQHCGIGTETRPSTGTSGYTYFGNHTRPDAYCHLNDGTTQVAPAIDGSNGYGPPVTWQTGFCIGDQAQFGTSDFQSAINDHARFRADFNGDGLPDVYCVHQDTHSIEVAFNTGTSFVSQGTWLTNFCSDYRGLMRGDFNGDGKTDFLCHVYNDGVGATYVALNNNGTSFSPGTLWGNFCAVNTSFDSRFTGVGYFRSNDNRTHIACQNADGSVSVALSTGSSFDTSQTAWLPSAPFCSSVAYPYEINNDGLIDIGCTNGRKAYSNGINQFIPQ